MFHFCRAFHDWIFLTAPLAFPAASCLHHLCASVDDRLFVLPHMIHASLTNSKIQGKYRHSSGVEIYETVLAWYIAPPTLVALINPHKGKFNVTAKGGLVEEEYVDWVISRALHLPFCSTQPGGRCGRHLALLLWAQPRCSPWSSYGVVFYNLICSWRRSCGTGRKQNRYADRNRGR